jgi:hypothetical protein
MVFNATFNNISAIFWQSALLVDETSEYTENHRPVASLSIYGVDLKKVVDPSLKYL